MISIVNYGLGNLSSIAKMLGKIGAAVEITSDRQRLAAAEKLILPGVGAFDSGMRNLRSLGLIETLNDEVIGRGKPVLGLCLGMQLMCARSEEGSDAGLGWFDVDVVKFHFDADDRLKVPHMGWNFVRRTRSHPLLDSFAATPRFYFVHSYHVPAAAGPAVLATTDYGAEFASMLARGNILGAQFHPEKSHRFGMELLTAFAGSPAFP